MKVAISLPDPVFDAAEKLASRMQVSRSQLYAQAIAEFLNHRQGSRVTEQLDAVYAVEPARIDPVLASAQHRALDDEAW
jgi:predicted transcriptional regulator